MSVAQKKHATYDNCDTDSGDCFFLFHMQNTDLSFLDLGFIIEVLQLFRNADFRSKTDGFLWLVLQNLKILCRFANTIQKENDLLGGKFVKTVGEWFVDKNEKNMVSLV